MATQTGRKYDIVLFGATSYTGLFILEELVRVARQEQIKWAVAGRDMERIQDVLDEVCLITGLECADADIEIADATNEESLNDMCKQTKLLLNVCGPFVHLGENVVRACIENNTHYVDVSGEVIFLERMQLKYNSLAKENKVYVIGACGFRCLPMELGVMFAQQKFEGDLNSLDVYLSTEGSVYYNNATFECQVYGYQTRHELKPLRQALYPSIEYFKPDHVVKPKSGIFYDKNNSLYCSTWPDAYKSVLYRSQRFLYENDKVRPVQCSMYVCHYSLWMMIVFLVTGFLTNFFARFSWGRSLLLKYPVIFSGGLVTPGGPKRDDMRHIKFALDFYGKGYPTRAKEGQTHEKQPDKPIITHVEGPEPGYITTGICAVQAALVVLKENEKMPNEGGVLPPAAAFRKTSIIDRLIKRKLKFAVLTGEEKDETLVTECSSPPVENEDKKTQ